MRGKNDKSQPPGFNLRSLREAKGWSLRQAEEQAKQLGHKITYSAIQRAEVNDGFQEDGLKKLADLYNVTVPDLFLPRELAGLKPESVAK